MKTEVFWKLYYVDCSVFIFRTQQSKHSHSFRTTTPWRWIL